jgi:hypothetical protein
LLNKQIEKAANVNKSEPTAVAKENISERLGLNNFKK